MADDRSGTAPLCLLSSVLCPPGSPSVSPLRLLVGIRFQELFHSPHRGAFHLSLTVLVHYRSLRST